MRIYVDVEQKVPLVPQLPPQQVRVEPDAGPAPRDEEPGLGAGPGGQLGPRTAHAVVRLQGGRDGGPGGEPAEQGAEDERLLDGDADAGPLEGEHAVRRVAHQADVLRHVGRRRRVFQLADGGYLDGVYALDELVDVSQQLYVFTGWGHLRRPCPGKLVIGC